MKILVAEDEPELLRTYKLLLEHEGFQAVTACDGQECIEAYKAELKKTTENNPPFDVVLLDYRMPKKNGAEVASEILALFPIQKLIMVTAYSGVQELKNETLKKIRVMAKPFEFEELFATVNYPCLKAWASSCFLDRAAISTGVTSRRSTGSNPSSSSPLRLMFRLEL